MIHRIPGVRGAQAYLLEHPEGAVIIDPGYIGSQRAALRFLASRGYAPEDLRWVILTHHHVDHSGTARELCRQTGAQLAVHADDAPYLAPGRPRERVTCWGLFDRLPVGIARFLVACTGPVGRILRDGDEIAGLHVIHAPGHTPGSICLWSARESALFVGDVLNNEHGLRRPPWTVNHDRRKAWQAPARLLGLEYERAYFGHGPALEEHASTAITRFVGRTA